MTDPTKMEQILDLLTKEEVKDALHFVEVMAKARSMDRAEANEWRRRILARQRFLELSEQSGPAN